MTLLDENAWSAADLPRDPESDPDWGARNMDRRSPCRVDCARRTRPGHGRERVATVSFQISGDLGRTCDRARGAFDRLVDG